MKYEVVSFNFTESYLISLSLPLDYKECGQQPLIMGWAFINNADNRYECSNFLQPQFLYLLIEIIYIYIKAADIPLTRIGWLYAKLYYLVQELRFFIPVLSNRIWKHWDRGEAAKLAHLIESASLKRKYMTKNYEKIFI